jgi:hypothetical protein
LALAKTTVGGCPVKPLTVADATVGESLKGDSRCDRSTCARPDHAGSKSKQTAA